LYRFDQRESWGVAEKPEMQAADDIVNANDNMDLEQWF
jgi:hypothetical protein